MVMADEEAGMCLTEDVDEIALSLRVKSPNWPVGELAIPAAPADTVFEIKSRIRAALNQRQDDTGGDLAEHEQRLIFGGQVLRDTATLRDTKVPRDATIHLVAARAPRSLAAGCAVDDASQRLSEGSQTAASSRQNSVRDEESANTASATVVQQEPADETDPAARVTSTDSAPMRASATTSDLESETESVVNTGYSYDLQLINGYPYLVQRPGPAERQAHQRAEGVRLRHRAQATARAASSFAARCPSGFRVRTNSGRAAIVLPPAAIAELASQGIHLSDAQSQQQALPGRLGFAARFHAPPAELGRNARQANRHNILAIDPARAIAFVREALPHGWLAVKLFVVVVLLSGHASWWRRFGLATAAIIIFLWQSGILSRLFAGTQRLAGDIVGAQGVVAQHRDRRRRMAEQQQHLRNEQPHERLHDNGTTQARATGANTARPHEHGAQQPVDNGALETVDRHEPVRHRAVDSPRSVMTAIMASFVASLLPGLDPRFNVAGDQQAPQNDAAVDND
ncbi:hypothetical protein PYCC9005_005877 [Savitreella phatthalungensis]